MINFSEGNKVWTLSNKYFEYIIGLNDNNHIFHVAFMPKSKAGTIDPESQLKRCAYNPVEAEVNINYEGIKAGHGSRYIGSPCSQRAIYKSHLINKLEDGEALVINQVDEASGLEIQLHYRLFENSPAIRKWVTVSNLSDKSIDLVHISSFNLYGFPFWTENDISEEIMLHTFPSSWAWEGGRKTYSANELGLYSKYTRYAWHIENNSSWVCQEYIPFFVIEEKSSKVFWAVQIEHSGPWRFEIGGSGTEGTNWVYAQGGLGNYLHSNWKKELKPKESFESVPVSLSVAEDELDNVLNYMHHHQANVLINRSRSDSEFPVIFNEWQTTQGKIREESVRQHISALKDTGVDIYVMDSGWFASYGVDDGKGDWWLTPGDWIEHPTRFPKGLKAIADEIKDKGLIPGIWLEIEIVGSLSEAYTKCEKLFMKNGNYFVEDGGRRFLYFGYPEAGKRADEIFERLISAGFKYFKIDYNSDCAPGCDNSEDSLGQGLLEHIRGYYDWLENLRRRHPEIIIESCSSGGMRLEYGMLSRADIASITDQDDYKELGNVFFGVSHTIHPSQALNWSIVKSGSTTREFVFTLVNSMLGRMCLSGDPFNYTNEQLELYKQAINFYKSYSSILKDPELFYHTEKLQFTINSGWEIMQMNSSEKDLIVVGAWRLDCSDDTKCIFLKGIDENYNYSIGSFPKSINGHISGKELIEKGFSIVNREKNSAKVIRIEKI